MLSDFPSSWLGGRQKIPPCLHLSCRLGVAIYLYRGRVYVSLVEEEL